VEVHASALKHGIDAQSVLTAASQPAYVAYLDDDNPARQFRLGFDEVGRLLELDVLQFDSGNELVIHAMKARPQYYDHEPIGLPLQQHTSQCTPATESSPYL